MSDSLKVLGQLVIPYPDFGTIYKVPENPSSSSGGPPNQAVVKTIVFCNTETSILLISSLNVVRKGDSEAVKNRILGMYTVPAGSDGNLVLSCGFTMSQGDNISAKMLTSNTKVSASVFGLEIT